MKVKKLIKILQKVHDKKGNVEVCISSSLGTDGSHVLCTINDVSEIKNQFNGFDQFCLSVEVSDQSKTQKQKDISAMKQVGYRYYRSQYVAPGKDPKVGLSNCDWHNLW